MLGQNKKPAALFYKNCSPNDVMEAAVYARHAVTSWMTLFSAVQSGVVSSWSLVYQRKFG